MESARNYLLAPIVSSALRPSPRTSLDPVALPDLRPRVSFRTAGRQARAITAVHGTPAWGAGIRAAIATFVPLLAAQLLQLPGEAGTWLSLAGFSGALVDRGGAPYRTRALTLALFAVLSALAVMAGSLAQHSLPVAVVATLLVAIACSLGRAWGNVGASIGGSLLNNFVIALAIPVTHGTLPRGGYILLGSAWVAVLALGLWPLRPYRPARLAVAACYQALGDFAAAVRDAIAPGAAAEVHAPPGSAEVRAALEHAAGVLAAIRRGRPGESPRGDRLVVLRESCDQLFGLAIALGDVVETIPRARRDDLLQRELAGALDDMIGVAAALGAGVLDERERPGPEVPRRAARIRDLLASRLDDLGPTERAQYEHATLVVERMEEFAAVASAVLSRMGSAQPALPDPASLSVAEEADGRGSLFAPLEAVLDHDSLVLRYALRVAIVTALAVWLTGQFDIPHGYWVTITAVVILQPYSGATTVKAMQRLIGTVLGGILTAALGAALHDPRWILVLSFLFAGICVAVLPINYALFSMFLTPTFVLLAEVGTGDWHLAEVRVLNTLLGGTLALLGSRLLWPRPEWSRFPTYAAAVLRENADFLRIVARDFGDRSEAATARMRAGRRRAGLAAINAEESFQRLMGEHQGGADGLAPLLTFLTYARRFGASIAALATSRHAVDPDTAVVLEGFTDRTTRALERGARQLEAHDAELRLTGEHALATPGRVAAAEPRDGSAPAAAPKPSRTPSAASVIPPPPATGDLVVRARLERLERQLALLLDGARTIAGAARD